MTANSVTLTPVAHTKEPCPCGCAPCEEECCRLDCLERPRFFCGQLLTDQDLTSLIGWTQNKLRLARFRHGWGVVCGLDVRCNPDPKHPGSVIVDPGYAISCCGDDIIVCEEKCFDLADACREQPDPCEELRKHKSKSEEQSNGERETWIWPPEQMRSVDLFIHYAEELADPQTALTRSVCKQVSECEYGRTRETFELRWTPAAADPLAEAEKKWLEAYQKCWEIVDKFPNEYWPTTATGTKRAKQARDSDHGRQIQEWFLRRIAEHPLRHFCLLRDWICLLDPKAIDQATVAKLLFLMVLDCLSERLSCDCYECEKSSGVPLARIHLYASVENGVRCCRVLAIDPHPPYRRLLGLSCWPAGQGRVNLAGAIWRHKDDAVAYLRSLNIDVGKKVLETLPNNQLALKKLVRTLAKDPCSGQTTESTCGSSI